MASDTQPQKLGLALSGGGFRASYFHIGVLAQMAEQGLLRHVEVISTVSGGSIIGALYYLHVSIAGIQARRGGHQPGLCGVSQTNRNGLQKGDGHKHPHVHLR